MWYQMQYIEDVVYDIATKKLTHRMNSSNFIELKDINIKVNPMTIWDYEIYISCISNINPF